MLDDKKNAEDMKEDIFSGEKYRSERSGSVTPDIDDDTMVIGKIDTSRMFSNPLHKADPNYYGDSHIDLGKFRFHLVSFLFSGAYMLYYRAYALYFITLLISMLLSSFLTPAVGSLGSVLTILLNLFLVIFFSISTPELIRYARVKKAAKLESKGLSEVEIANKLRPSWMPVIIFFIIYAILVVLMIIGIFFILYAFRDFKSLAPADFTM